jgi:alkylation response protein AidB-like acyl-CoA dehydrogenase
VQDIGPAGPLFDAIRDYGAFACAGLLQGIAERSLELAVAYAKERIQFGRPIGSFQAIQHKAADMRIASEVGRVLVLRAAAEKDPKRFSLAASRAKAWNGDAVRKITREAMQIFGGVSFAGDHPIQLMYQAVITLGSHYEAAHEHRARLAAELLG